MQSRQKPYIQNGQLFYIVPSNAFYKLSVTGAVYTLTLQNGTNGTGNYTAKLGPPRSVFPT
jgi:hypothetical protein